MLAGSRLTLYVQGTLTVEGASRFNANTADPTLVEIYVNGTTTFTVNSESRVHAQFTALQGGLSIGSSSDVYGTFTGSDLKIDGSSGLHVDTMGTSSSAAGAGATMGYWERFLPLPHDFWLSEMGVPENGPTLVVPIVRFGDDSQSTDIRVVQSGPVPLVATHQPVTRTRPPSVEAYGWFDDR